MSQRFSITLAQLGYFVECAKTLNMTVASHKLHVAQSAVSTAISHLERALDTTLFIRQRAKGLVLTPAGAQLLVDTQRIFGLLSDSIDTIRAESDEVRGTITVACFTVIAPFLLPIVLGHLRKKHPGLHVEFIEGDNEQTLQALRSGRAELAISYRFASSAGIVCEHVRNVRPHVILPPDHPLAKRESIALADLADEPLVLLDLPESSGYFLKILHRAAVTPRLKYRTTNYETVRSMVAMGFGYSILNQRPAIPSTYTGGTVTTLEISDDLPALEVVISTLEQVRLSSRACAVAAAIHEVLGDERKALDTGSE